MECGYYDFQVQPREVDLTKRATLIALGDHILHTAGEDADRNGFGIRTLPLAEFLKEIAQENDDTGKAGAKQIEFAF